MKVVLGDRFERLCLPCCYIYMYALISIDVAGGAEEREATKLWVLKYIINRKQIRRCYIQHA